MYDDEIHPKNKIVKDALNDDSVDHLGKLVLRKSITCKVKSNRMSMYIAIRFTFNEAFSLTL